MKETLGLDDWLWELLTLEASRVGESVDVFVLRAVQLRLLQTSAHSNDSPGDLLLKYLVEKHLRRGDPSYQPQSPVLADPGRLAAVAATGLLDAPVSDSNLRTVRLAADALDARGAAISLVDRDRQFFVSVLGLPDEVQSARQTTLDYSVCKYVVMSGRPLVVSDARTDTVLSSHPAVTHGSVVAYLGVPLMSPAGYIVGALCVWDSRPRNWGLAHTRILQDFAWLVRDGDLRPAFTQQ